MHSVSTKRGQEGSPLSPQGPLEFGVITKAMEKKCHFLNWFRTLVRNAAEEIAEIVLHDSTAAPPHLDISGVALNLLTHESQHARRRLLSAEGQRCDKTHPALLLSAHGEQRAGERGGIGSLMMCGRGAEAAASISSAGHGGHKAGGWWHCGGEGGQCSGPSAASSPAG